MQTVNRETLLESLEHVAPGTSIKEKVEQANCFVFTEGYVSTFNGEVACSMPTDVGIEGAVRAAPLLAMLRSLEDDTIEVRVADGHLYLTTEAEETKIAMESEILLPVDAIPKPDDWKKTDPDFCEAVKMTSKCAGTDASRFHLTCLHITSDFVESCDNYQLMRYKVKTGIEGEALIRSESLSHIIELDDMRKVALSKEWLHFRNKRGLIMSFRTHIEEYPPIDKMISKGGVPITLPALVIKRAHRANIFSSENADANRVKVQLRSGKMRIEGRGSLGEYKGTNRVKYDGPNTSFLIDPELLATIVTEHNEGCTVSKDRLIVANEKFTYIVCLDSEQKD